LTERKITLVRSEVKRKIGIGDFR